MMADKDRLAQEAGRLTKIVREMIIAVHQEARVVREMIFHGTDKETTIHSHASFKESARAKEATDTDHPANATPEANLRLTEIFLQGTK